MGSRKYIAFDFDLKRLRFMRPEPLVSRDRANNHPFVRPLIVAGISESRRRARVDIPPHTAGAITLEMI